MPNLNSQEEKYKRDFLQHHLAALRGERFEIPGAVNNTNFSENPEEGSQEDPANNTRFFSEGSEDTLLAQYPLAPAFPGAISSPVADPQTFSSLQRQARMAQGVGAPSYLPEDVAALPDPEYSTEETPVSFEESLELLEQQAREAEDIEASQAIRNTIQQKVDSALEQAAEKMREMVKEKTSRWVAKAAGNGSNASDIVGWDAFITFMLTYAYLFARFIRSILAPDSSYEDGNIIAYAKQKGLNVLLPEYRLLKEPGDVLYFIFSSVLFTLIITFVAAAIIFMMIPILYPLFSPLAPVVTQLTK